MKKLRILFLAVLAMALAVSGAFAAETLPTASFDKKITVNNGTAGSVTSVDVVSPDATTAVIKFDFSAYSKDYTIALSGDVAGLGFKVGSKDYVITVSFDAANTTAGAKVSGDYPISFKFFEKDNTGGDDEATLTYYTIEETAQDTITDEEKFKAFTTDTLYYEDKGNYIKATEFSAGTDAVSTYYVGSLGEAITAENATAFSEISTTKSYYIKTEGSTSTIATTEEFVTGVATYYVGNFGDAITDVTTDNYSTKVTTSEGEKVYYVDTANSTIEEATAFVDAQPVTYYTIVATPATSVVDQTTFEAVTDPLYYKDESDNYIVASKYGDPSSSETGEADGTTEGDSTGNEDSSTGEAGSGDGQGAVFDEYLLRQSYAAAETATAKYTFTFTVHYDAGSTTTDSTTTKTASADIDWYSTSTAYAFNNKTWTLRLSADKAGVTRTAAIVVSSDFTATPALVLMPTSNDYVTFTLGKATPATSTDERGNVYTFSVKATPKSTDMTGSAFKVYAKVTSGSTVLSTDVLSFTVLVSNDKTTSGDSGSEGGSTITDWTLTATADKTSATLSYYEKAEVTITARPADEGVDFVITTDADEDADYTLVSDDGNFSTTGYVVKYTFTAGETEEEFPIKFTVTATSGDDEQTESVDVVFTVEYDSSKAATIKPEEPEDLAAELGAADGAPARRTVGGHEFLIHSENDRKTMFAAGRGVVGWGVRAPFKVRRVFGQLGWWFRFLNAVANAYFDLNAPATYGASTASIAADDDGVASRDAALSVGFEDDYTAFFELDLEKAAATLPEGATYQANSSYTPDATADDGGAASDPMTAGELKGAKSSSGGGEQGGGDDGKETIDNLLGGTSGGCDAGFGALALALAATMIFVRKRS